MYFSDGKIIVHRDNSEDTLYGAHVRLREWMLEEKNVLLPEPKIGYDKDFHFPYLVVDERIKPLYIDEVLAPHVKLGAINSSLFKKPGPEQLTVRYEFSEKEKVAMLKESAQCQVDKLKEEAERTRIMKEMKAKIDTLSRQINRLTQKAVNGFEHRQLLCTLELDFKKGKRTWRQVEKPHKVVLVEDLQPEDFQLLIEHDAGMLPSAKPAKAGGRPAVASR